MVKQGRAHCFAEDKGTKTLKARMPEDAVAAIDAAIGADRPLTATEAELRGYVSAEFYGKCHSMGTRGAQGRLNQDFKRGVLERIHVAIPGSSGQRSFWYRAKESKP